MPAPTFIAEGHSNAGTGTAVTSTAVNAAITVQAGDLVVVESKWEGANGATCTVNSQSGTTYANAGSVIDSAINSDLHMQVSWGVAAASGTLTPTNTLSAARPWTEMRVRVFRPGTGGNSWSVDSVSASNEANSTTISTTNPTASASGVSVFSVALYAGLTVTFATNWLSAVADQATSAAMSYYLLSAAGSPSPSPSGTIVSANVWLARTVTFVEVAGVVSDGNYPIRSEMYF